MDVFNRMQWLGLVCLVFIVASIVTFSTYLIKTDHELKQTRVELANAKNELAQTKKDLDIALLHQQGKLEWAPMKGAEMKPAMPREEFDLLLEWMDLRRQCDHFGPVPGNVITSGGADGHQWCDEHYESLGAATEQWFKKHKR